MTANARRTRSFARNGGKRLRSREFRMDLEGPIPSAPGLWSPGPTAGQWRSSLRDYVFPHLGDTREVVEAALAHTVRDQTEAAYARSDLFERRRHLMDDWTEYLAETRGQVLSLKR